MKEGELPSFAARSRYSFNLQSNGTLRNSIYTKTIRKEPRKVLDFACGDPYYNIKREHRAIFGQEAAQKVRIDQAIESLNHYPRMRREVMETI